MAKFKCESCGREAEEPGECCGAPMKEQEATAEAPAEQPATEETTEESSN